MFLINIIIFLFNIKKNCQTSNTAENISSTVISAIIVLSFRALDHFTTFEMALQGNVYVSFILKQVKSLVNVLLLGVTRQIFY